MRRPIGQFLQRAANLYWQYRSIRITLAILQIVVITVLSFCIQCRMEGIPVLTEIPLWDVLVYIYDYHYRQLSWFVFRLRYWSNFNSDGHFFALVPNTLPRMA